MEQQKKSIVPMILVGTVLILALPLIYLLVARVILPLEWNEPQFNQDSGSVVEPD